MKLISTIALLILISCGQDFNSNSFDKEIYGAGAQDIDTTTPDGQRFLKAFKIIEDKCLSCHLNTHNYYATLTSSQDWITFNLIEKGNFANSRIIEELKNYDGDMPQGGSELSQQDIDYLRDWIENIP